MGLKSAIVMAGCLSTIATAAAATAVDDKAQSRFLRKRQRGRLLNKHKPTKKKIMKAAHQDMDITAEDVGFWTRTLQQSVPMTPNPTFGPATPNPTDLGPATPNPTDLGPATPNPTDISATPNPTDVVTPAPSTLSLEPTPSPTTENPTISPSASPTFPCNLTPDERAIQIRELMSTVSDPATFDDPSSPQSQALDWITNEDAIVPIMCPNQENLGCSLGGTINPMIQRYVMAVFYFSTNGDTSWEQCSAPDNVDSDASVAEANANCERVVTPFGVANDRVGDTSTDAWLGPSNECQWGGMACWGLDTPNLNLCIDQLDFGK